MEAYREKLKINQRICTVCALVLLSFGLWALGAEFFDLPFPQPRANEHWQSMWRGFISGACSGVLLLLVLGIIRCAMALKNEEKLKKLYVEENDERMGMVRRMAGATAAASVLPIGIVAAIIAGVFSITVSLTIICCITVESLLILGFKFYYQSKY